MAYFKMPEIFYTAPPPPTLKIKYGKKPMQHINVRIPDGGGPHPTLFVFHGGKWMSHYRVKQTEYLCASLQDNGIATCNIEFTRLGHVNGGWPKTFEDLADATDLIMQKTVELEIDPDRISVLGHSSGAHLALCLCAQNRILNRNLAFTPQNAIALAGVFDLAAATNLKKEIGMFFVNHPIVDPISLLPLGINQVVLCGSKDKLVNQAISYAEAAKKAGDKVKVEIIDKCSHLRIIDPTAPYWPQIEKEITDVLL